MGTDGSGISASEIGAEVLLFIVSYSIAGAAIGLAILEFKTYNSKDMTMVLSSCFKLFLPLLSYMDLQAQQHEAYERSQLILLWTVLSELTHMSTDLMQPWELWDSIEQCIRLAWAGYLVYGSNGPSQAVRIILLLICSASFVYVIFQGITLKRAENSLRLGKNPQIIDLYMKQILEEADPEASPMNVPMSSCEYVVFGEETQKINFGHSTYLIDQNNSKDSLITIGRVYQSKPEDEVFTSMYPHWREVCVSFALAKILRRRFDGLPLVETGSRKALRFVNMALIGFGSDDGNEDFMNEEITVDNNAFRTFYTIQKELFFLSDLLRIKLQLKWILRYGCSHWKNLVTFRGYLEDPRKWECLSKQASRRFYRCLLSVWYFLKEVPTTKDVELSLLDINCIPSMKFGNLELVVDSAANNVDVQKALLRSFRMSGAELTNGQASLSRHGVIEHLGWACQPSQSNTEAILVWHIATTLFHDHNPPHRPLDSYARVALALSSYFVYLIMLRPELLPDVVDWTRKLYTGVNEEISRVKWLGCKSRAEYCHKIRDETWNDDSLVGKGVRLVKILVEIEETQDDKQVWEILADFWAEMMLYVAPSDNVEGHRALLDSGELITQLWALLTHAGIIARPEIPNHQDQAGSSAV